MRVFVALKADEFFFILILKTMLFASVDMPRGLYLFYFILFDVISFYVLVRLTAWLLILLMNGLWQRGLLIRLSSYLTYGRSILHFIHLTVTSKHIWGILYYSSRHISVVCIVYEWHSLAAWIHVQISSKLVI
jgi:hypothetical protein